MCPLPFFLPAFSSEIEPSTEAVLGVAADAFDPLGEPLVGELGELVITRPMPSMPVELWGDTDGSLYRSSYFELFPGVWRQGDWIKFSERGSCDVLCSRVAATVCQPHHGKMFRASEAPLLVQEGWREAPGWSLTHHQPERCPVDCL